ncbi:MAG: serine/threonine protein kinase [Actinomycetota bacterium]|nr:serine/threonine protein kinase [Actinomycetota bacterium]
MTSTDSARRIGGRYQLLEMLGRGGMGVVWRARDELLGRLVAIKEVLPPAGLTSGERHVLRDHTLREARAAARIHSRAAVTVFDVVEQDGRPWIVMELLEARSLAEVLRDQGPCTPAETARVGLAVLDALEAAHRAGVVHRDVKPANVLLADSRVVLTDFGVAALDGDPTLTMTGTVLGSPAYMAPERLKGRPPSPQMDMWSLGATLYAAVEGAPPFVRPDAVATLQAVLNDPVPAPRRAGALTPVLEGLLVRDPAQRLDPPRVRQLLQRALQQSDSETTTALPLPVPPPPPVVERTVAVVANPTEEQRHRAEEEGELVAPPAPAPGQPAPVPTAPVPTAPVRPAGGGSQGPPLAPAGRRPPGGGRRRGLIVTGLLLLALAGGLIAWAAAREPASTTPAAPQAPSSVPAANPPAPVSVPPTTPAAASTPPPSTPLPSTPSPSMSPSPSASPSASPSVRGGFESYTDSTGFSLAVPTGWRREQRDTGLFFIEPGTGRYLQVAQTRNPKDDPLEDWRDQERHLRRRLNDYEHISLERVDYRGWDTADLEFRWTSDSGRRLHVRNRNVITAPDRAYALLFSAPEDRWAESQQLYAVFATSFRPAS